METRDQIRQYILKSSMTAKENITDKTLIFEQGLLDSMGLLFLVQFLNDEFKVVTHDQELIKENFESIDSIVSFVEGKMEPSTAGQLTV